MEQKLSANNSNNNNNNNNNVIKSVNDLNSINNINEDDLSDISVLKQIKSFKLRKEDLDDDDNDDEDDDDNDVDNVNKNLNHDLDDDDDDDDDDDYEDDEDIEDEDDDIVDDDDDDDDDSDDEDDNLDDDDDEIDDDDDDDDDDDNNNLYNEFNNNNNNINTSNSNINNKNNSYNKSNLTIKKNKLLNYDNNNQLINDSSTQLPLDNDTRAKLEVLLANQGIESITNDLFNNPDIMHALATTFIKTFNEAELLTNSYTNNIAASGINNTSGLTLTTTTTTNALTSSSLNNINKVKKRKKFYNKIKSTTNKKFDKKNEMKIKDLISASSASSSAAVSLSSSKSSIFENQQNISKNLKQHETIQQQTNEFINKINNAESILNKLNEIKLINDNEYQINYLNKTTATGNNNNNYNNSTFKNNTVNNSTIQQQQKLQSMISSSSSSSSTATNTTTTTTTTATLLNNNNNTSTINNQQKKVIVGKSLTELLEENADSVLGLACASGYIELVTVLLAINANIEDKGHKNESTPLMEACGNGHKQIVELLIKHGANVNAQSSCGNTPLHYAVQNNHPDIVDLLIKNQAKIEEPNENGHTPLMEAASAGHVDCARILLEAGAGVNTHSNEFKETALTLACYKGNVEMVKFLLERGADQEHKTDEMHTALMEACMDGHADVAKLLLDHGAQVNMPPDSFESPLTLAACGGHVELANLLIERGADLEERNDEGYTPLMEAAREGHEEMVALLLFHDADINAITEETQETALTLACCGGCYEVAKFLIEAGADVNLGASTPLMEASQEGHIELVQLLLSSNALVNQCTTAGETALSLACENGHTEVAELLITSGAHIDVPDPEKGYTPLMKASRAGHVSTVEFLLKHGANINQSTPYNEHTVLSLACSGGHLPLVELLLANGADSCVILKDNSNCLIEAAKGGHTRIVQSLLDWPKNCQYYIPPSLPSTTIQNNNSQLFPDIINPEQYLNEDDIPFPSIESFEQSRIPTLTFEQFEASIESTNLLNTQSNQTNTLEDEALIVKTNDAIFNNLQLNSDSSPQTTVTINKTSKQSNLINNNQISKNKTTKLNKITKLITKELNSNQNIPFNIQTLPFNTSTITSLPPVPPSSPQILSSELIQQHQNINITDNSINNQQQQLDCCTSKPDVALENLVNMLHKLAFGENSERLSLLPDQLQDQQQISITNKKYFKNQQKNNDFNSNNNNNKSKEEQIKRKEILLKELQKIEKQLEEKAETQTRLNNIQLQSPSTQESSSSLSTITTNLKSTSKKSNINQSNSEMTNYQRICIISKYLINKCEDDLNKIKENLNETSMNSLLTSTTTTTTTLTSQNQKISTRKLRSEHHNQNQNQNHHEINDQPNNNRLLNKFLENAIKNTTQTPLSPQQDTELFKNFSLSTTPPQTLITKSQINTTNNNNNINNNNSTKRRLSKIDELQQQLSLLLPTTIDNLDIQNQNTNILQNKQQQIISNSLIEFKKFYNNNSQTTTASQKTLNSNEDNQQQQQQQTPDLTQISPQFDFNDPELQLKTAIYFKPTNNIELQQFLQTHFNKNNKNNNSNESSTTDSLPSIPIETQTTITNEQIERSLDLSTPPPPQSFLLQQSTINRQNNYNQQCHRHHHHHHHHHHNHVHNNNNNNNNNSNNNINCNQNSNKSEDWISNVLTTQKNVAITSTTTSKNTSKSIINLEAETDSNHDTALTLACQGGHDELVKLLIEKGSNIEHRDKKGFTPLILAATAGFSKIVQILIEYNADIEAQSERTKDTALSAACQGGRYEVVEILLKHGANKEHRNISDYTPLSLAASNGYVNIIKLLLENNVEINSRTGSKLGISPLMLAAMNGHTQAVKLLLDMGSDINAQIETNRNTALTLSCFQGRADVVNLLLERKANIEHRAKTGLTPLMEAASGGYESVGRVLIDKGADVNAPPVPMSKDTALTIASDKGHVKFVQLLIENGAIIDARNKKGYTPLWSACNSGHLEVCQLLVTNGANTDIEDTKHISCLMAAFRKGHLKIVKYMVKHVKQFPSDTDCMRYIQTLTDKDLAKKCQQCMEIIINAKEKQAQEANKIANSLLKEIDAEKTREKSKKAAAARKREKRKMKKKMLKESTNEKNNEGDEGDEGELDEVEIEKINDIILNKNDNEKENEIEDKKLIEQKEQNLQNQQNKKKNKKNSNDNKKKKQQQQQQQQQNLELENTNKEKSVLTLSTQLQTQTQTQIEKQPSSQPQSQTQSQTPSASKKSQSNNKSDRKSNSSQTNSQKVEKTENRSLSNPKRSNSKTNEDNNIKKFDSTQKEQTQVIETAVIKQEVPIKQIEKTSKIVQESSLAALDDFEPITNIKLKKQSKTNINNNNNNSKSSNNNSIDDNDWKEVINTNFTKQKRLHIPNDKFVRVIGRGNNNIKSIIEVTGASLEIEKTTNLNDNKYIIVKGTNESVKHATQLLMALISNSDTDLMNLLPNNNNSKNISPIEVVTSIKPASIPSTSSMTTIASTNTTGISIENNNRQVNKSSINIANRSISNKKPIIPSTGIKPNTSSTITTNTTLSTTVSWATNTNPTHTHDRTYNPFLGSSLLTTAAPIENTKQNTESNDLIPTSNQTIIKSVSNSTINTVKRLNFAEVAKQSLSSPNNDIIISNANKISSYKRNTSISPSLLISNTNTVPSSILSAAATATTTSIATSTIPKTVTTTTSSILVTTSSSLPITSLASTNQSVKILKSDYSRNNSSNKNILTQTVSKIDDNNNLDEQKRLLKSKPISVVQPSYSSISQSAKQSQSTPSLINSDIIGNNNSLNKTSETNENTNLTQLQQQQQQQQQQPLIKVLSPANQLQSKLQQQHHQQQQQQQQQQIFNNIIYNSFIQNPQKLYNTTLINNVPILSNLQQQHLFYNQQNEIQQQPSPVDLTSYLNSYMNQLSPIPTTSQQTNTLKQQLLLSSPTTSLPLINPNYLAPQPQSNFLNDYSNSNNETTSLTNSLINPPRNLDDKKWISSSSAAAGISINSQSTVTTTLAPLSNNSQIKSEINENIPKPIGHERNKLQNLNISLHKQQSATPLQTTMTSQQPQISSLFLNQFNTQNDILSNHGFNQNYFPTNTIPQQPQQPQLNKLQYLSNDFYNKQNGGNIDDFNAIKYPENHLIGQQTLQMPSSSNMVPTPSRTSLTSNTHENYQWQIPPNNYNNNINRYPTATIAPSYIPNFSFYNDPLNQLNLNDIKNPNWNSQQHNIIQQHNPLNPT